MKKWNHYFCPSCKGITVARHDNEGVTPFTIRCRAKDTFGVNGARAHGCEEAAHSQFFDVSQDDNQKPHVVFYRPELIDAIEAINKQPVQARPWYLEHYMKGGALMREVRPEAI